MAYIRYKQERGSPWFLKDWRGQSIGEEKFQEMLFNEIISDVVFDMRKYNKKL